MAKEKKLPKVTVLERRLKNPFGTPSEGVTFKEGAWMARWFSEALRTGRIHQAVTLGWDFVEPGDLATPAADLGFQVVDNRVVRGDAASREVLMKMPQADFDAVQKAKADTNTRNLNSGKKMKEEAANRATAHFGTDEAGEAIYKSDIDVRDSRVRYELDDTP